MNQSFQSIINNNTPVLIDFYANWCGPCKMMPPVLKEVKDKLGNNISIFKVDVDAHPDVAGAYNVGSIPTLMLFRNGKLLWREPGVKSAPQLLQLIRQYAP